MAECRFLFVYGTLLPWAIGELGRSERERLREASVSVDTASTSGCLVDLVGYPGLIAGAGRVWGAVYDLKNPAFTLSWLDEYEGITGADTDEYRRGLQQVRCDGGYELEGNIYIYRGSAGTGRPISGGRWQTADDTAM